MSLGNARTCASISSDAVSYTHLIQRYLGKISGPLLDRIDLHVEVPAVAYQEMRGKETGATSAQMRQRVLAARGRQAERGRCV